MNLDPLSLGIGLGLGLIVGVLVLMVRGSNPPVQVRVFNTRLTSLNLELDRSRRELSYARALNARLLDEQQEAAKKTDPIGSQLNHFSAHDFSADVSVAADDLPADDLPADDLPADVSSADDLRTGIDSSANDSSTGDLVVDLTDIGALKLTHVTGIGPKLAITLASYGITDLKRLASITDEEVAVIESSAPSLVERMTRERWLEQAIRILESPPSSSEREWGSHKSRRSIGRPV